VVTKKAKRRAEKSRTIYFNRWTNYNSRGYESYSNTRVMISILPKKYKNLIIINYGIGRRNFSTTIIRTQTNKKKYTGNTEKKSTENKTIVLVTRKVWNFQQIYINFSYLKREGKLSGIIHTMMLISSVRICTSVTYLLEKASASWSMASRNTAASALSSS